MWPNPQFPADLVSFTEEILNGKTSFFLQWTFRMKTYSVILMSLELDSRLTQNFPQNFAEIEKINICLKLFEPNYWRYGKFY